MAQRRMFSNRIANSAKFLQMPVEAQLLYFHMILRSDDDGVVESYPLMKLLGVAPDNFRVLAAKNFIRVLNEDQVILITDWLEHNTIRADRKVDSIYKHLLPPDVKVIAPKPRSDVEDNSRRIGGQSTDGIGKVRLGKIRLDNISPSPTVMERVSFDVFWNIYPKKVEKKKAEAKWNKLSASKQKAAVEDIPRRVRTSQWQEEGGRYIPNPTTYLNGERWDDAIEVPTGPTNKTYGTCGHYKTRKNEKCPYCT